LGEKVDVILNRLHKFGVLGIKIPEIDPEAVADLRVSDEDMVILNEIEPETYSSWSNSEVRTWRVPGAHLLYTANELDESVDVVFERLRQFEALGILPPEFDVKVMSNFRVETRDLIALSRDLDAVAPWVEGDVSAVHVLRAANRMDEPVDRVLERLRRLALVGLRLPVTENLAIEGLGVSREDLALLSVDVDGLAPWLDDRVSPEHLLYASSRLNEAVDVVLARLRRFEPVGIQLPVVDDKAIAGLKVSPEDLILLSADVEGTPPWIEEQTSIIHILRAANRLGEEVNVVLNRLQRLEPVGIEVPYIEVSHVKGLEVSDEDLVLLSQELDGSSPWVDGETPVIHLLRASTYFNQPIERIRRRLKKFEVLGLTQIAPVFSQPEWVGGSEGRNPGF
jgi:hypothetical protein